jgi:Fanconi anemia group M protein
MTGAMNPTDRKKQWREKRVFFLTPQVLANDISRSTCPATEVKCLVLDEAHKAQGSFAYVSVVEELCKLGAVFRILALSATPGKPILIFNHYFSHKFLVFLIKKIF